MNSYQKNKCHWAESHRRPPDYESGDLTADLQWQKRRSVSSNRGPSDLLACARNWRPVHMQSIFALLDRLGLCDVNGSLEKIALKRLKKAP